jgi:hypothetical protein
MSEDRHNIGTTRTEAATRAQELGMPYLERKAHVDWLTLVNTPGDQLNKALVVEWLDGQVALHSEIVREGEPGGVSERLEGYEKALEGTKRGGDVSDTVSFLREEARAWEGLAAQRGDWPSQKAVSLRRISTRFEKAADLFEMGDMEELLTRGS